MRITGIDVPAGSNLGWATADEDVVESGQHVIESDSDLYAKIRDLAKHSDAIYAERPCGSFLSTVAKLWRSVGIISVAAEHERCRFELISPSSVDKLLGIKKEDGKTRKHRINKTLADMGFGDIKAKHQHMADAIATALAAEIQNRRIEESIRAQAKDDK